MTLLNHVRLLKFPPTPYILWDQTPLGEAVTISLRQSVQVQVAHNFWQNENLVDPKSHWLVLHGTVLIKHADVEVDKILVKINGVGHGDENIDGYCLIPCRVVRNIGINKTSFHTENECVKRKLIKSFFQFLKTKDINLAAIFPVCGLCYCMSTENEIIMKLQLTGITCDTDFQAVPVTAVPIIHTALSRCLLLELHQSHSTPKSGFLSMNETRQLLLVLENDPNACSLPLLGIWVTGVAVVHNTFVLAACLRYCKSLHLKNRVCVPPNSFLVVLFVPNSTKPLFYECFGSAINKEEKLRLFKGAAAVSHKKVCGKLNPHSTEVMFELQPGESLCAGTVFDNYNSVWEASDNRVDANEMPRPTPSPHESELQEVLSTPTVPDLSVSAESDSIFQVQLDRSPQTSNHEALAASLQNSSRLPELLHKVQCLLQNAPHLKSLDTLEQTDINASALTLASLERERIATDISNHSTIGADGLNLSLNKSDLNLTRAFSKFELDDVSIIVEEESKLGSAVNNNNANSFMADYPFCSSPANTVSTLKSVSNCSSTAEDIEELKCAPVIHKSKQASKMGQDGKLHLFLSEGQVKDADDPANKVFLPLSNNRIFNNERADNGNPHRTEQKQAISEALSNEVLNHTELVPKTVISKDGFASQLFCSEKCLPERKNHTRQPSSPNAGKPNYPSKVMETSLASLTLGDMPLGTICDQHPSPCCTIHLDLKEYPDSVQESEFGSTFPAENLQTNNVKPTGVFYQNMLDKVHWMLTDVNQKQQRTGGSDTKDDFNNLEPCTQDMNTSLMNDGDSPLQNSCLDFVLSQHSRVFYNGSLLLPQLNYVSLHKSPDVSFQIDQLARKYLNKEPCSVDYSIVKKKSKDKTEMALSFATRQYLAKHGLLGNLDKSKAAQITEPQSVPEDDTNYIAMSFATRQYLKRYGLLHAVATTPTSPLTSPEMKTIVEDVRPNSAAKDSANILNIAKLRSQPKLF